MVAELLRRRGIRPRRRWGQNFLVDANLLDRVAQAGEIAEGEAVLEIGPGLGALTRALARRAGRVLAVEVDPLLCAALAEETVADLPQVRLVCADFLSLDLPEVLPRELGPGRHPVVANIPYSITGPVIVRLLENFRLFDRIVLMVQKEVADRLAARPATPEYGSLTLFVDLYASVRRVAPVSRRAFLPQPEVDSAIVRLDVRPAPRFADPAGYLRVVQAAFRQRRKHLGNALTGPPLEWERGHALAALSAAGIDPARRGETLAPEEFALLANAGTAPEGRPAGAAGSSFGGERPEGGET